ncbi:unnamed protein product [Lymnaea stagnalis]|uniref:Uncharacterized protein n=1 Tax=Lymnaea stagnalis TaxID=6523 RepID=A0AAV2H7R6_LYMST
MSGLRRSRPEEQDAALNKLLFIKLSLNSNSESEPEQTHFSPSANKNEEDQEVFLATELDGEMKNLFSEISPTLRRHTDQSNSSSPQKYSTFLDKSISHNDLHLSPLQHLDQALQSPTLSPKPLARSKLTTPPAVVKTSPDQAKNFTLSPSKSKTTKSKSVTSSPNLTLKKYFSTQMIMRSDFQQGHTRRGSEPLLDTRSHFQVNQTGVTEQKWAKLRSILVSMQEQPLGMEEIMQSSPPDLLVNLKEKISAQEQLIKLQNELSTLRDNLWQMENELQTAGSERDAALACLHQMQSALNTSDSRNEEYPNVPQDNMINYWEQGVDSLKSSDVTKEEVLDIMEHLIKDFKGQRSYLDRLMMVVMTRAPWMLGEVDKLEGYIYDNDESSFYNDSDEEFMC